MEGGGKGRKRRQQVGWKGLIEEGGVGGDGGLERFWGIKE